MVVRISQIVLALLIILIAGCSFKKRANSQIIPGILHTKATALTLYINANKFDSSK